MWAARCGEAGAVKILVESGRADVDGRDSDGRSALSHAAICSGGAGIATPLKVIVRKGRVLAEVSGAGPNVGCSTGSGDGFFN